MRAISTHITIHKTTMPLDIETIRRLTLARHLYQLGQSSLASPNDMLLFAGVNLLQDAVEAFLIAVSDYVQAKNDQNQQFAKFFDHINEKIHPKELPFKTKLIRLNRIRVDSKHYGIQPARDECERVVVSVREFFDEVSDSILGVNFSTVSTINLLDDGETKELLLQAKAALESGDLEACVITCRKVLYVAIETNYDVARFKDDQKLGFLASFSHAPFYAKNAKYIAENVKDPTDYIVRDHSRIDQDLLKDGVDTTAFWNVWRLTPAVYRLENKEWLVKYEFGKLDKKMLADSAEYVFSTVLDIALAISSSRRAAKWQAHQRFYVKLIREGVPIYEKADRSSKVTAITPPGMTQIDTDFRVPGLVDEGPYWHVSDIGGKMWLWGYVHVDDIE